jgi:hypothetical protein
MIIKVLSRKSNTGTLMNYLFKYIHNEDKTSAKQFIVRHNIRGTNIQEYTQEFEANEVIRVHKRKNQPSVYHTILSWHKSDAKFLDDAKLRILTKEFITQRGSLNKYVVSKHMDREHIHLHVAVSATNILGKSSSISKQAFGQLKISMDKFQREKFPELSHSLPQHGKKKEEQKIWAKMQQELKQIEALRASTDREVKHEFERKRELLLDV